MRVWTAGLGMALLGGALLSFFPVGVSKLPRSTVDRWISVEQARRLGASLLRTAPFAFPPPGNSVDAQLGRIVSYLVKYNPDLGDAGLSIRSSTRPEVGAFAVPGGTIVVTWGMIRKAKSAEELLAVIAHEIAHLQERHWARGIGGRPSAWHGAELLGLMLNPEWTGQAMGGEDFFSVGFTPAFEREADALGVRYIQEAGVSGTALVRFLEDLRVEKMGSADFLSAHPATRERLAELREVVKTARRRAMFMDPVPIQLAELQAAAR